MFLKGQHSFRHLSIAQKFQRRPSKPESVQAGCLKELGDLELRILPHSHLEALLKDQALEDPFQGHERQSLQIEHYECCHKPLPEFSNIESLSVVHHALGFLPDPTQREVLLEEIDSDEEEDSP